MFIGNIICKGAERHINQDFISRKEKTFSEMKINIKSIIASNKVFVDKKINKKEHIINLFFFRKKDPKEIAKYLDCSVQYVYRQIKEAKEKIFKE